MRIVIASPLLLLVAACAGLDGPAPRLEPDYSDLIKSKFDALRTRAANIAFDYSKSSDSAEAIATAVVTLCASDIDELARMQVTQASRGLTQRQRQMLRDREPEERGRRLIKSAVYERAVADVLEFRTDAAKAETELATKLPRALAKTSEELLLVVQDLTATALLDSNGADRPAEQIALSVLTDSALHLESVLEATRPDKQSGQEALPGDAERIATWKRNMRAGLQSTIKDFVIGIVTDYRSAKAGKLQPGSGPAESRQVRIPRL